MSPYVIDVAKELVKASKSSDVQVRIAVIIAIERILRGVGNGAAQALKQSLSLPFLKPVTKQTALGMATGAQSRGY